MTWSFNVTAIDKATAIEQIGDPLVTGHEFPHGLVGAVQDLVDFLPEGGVSVSCQGHSGAGGGSVTVHVTNVVAQ